MCGINLYVNKCSGPAEIILNNMMLATLHRGPDARGETWIEMDGYIAGFGANRLKISDPSDAANQPFHDDSHRYMLIFNGEIFNSESLRSVLEAEGQLFRTRSDTEVLLKWLIARGAQGISSLQGMFALIFADTAERKIFLARDPSGIKPLYYHVDGALLMASSDLRALLAGGVKTEIQTHQVDYYFNYRAVHYPDTMIRGIDQVIPGETLIWHRGEVSRSAAPRKATETGSTDPEKLAGQMEELLKAALIRHVAGDVPSGLLLSGGVDSTLLLALASANGLKLPTFSLVFGRDASANRAASRYGSEHRSLFFNQHSLDDFGEFIAGLDHPVADSGAYATWLICREASKEVKVVLSGAGADELFGGYNRHWAYHQYLHYRNNLRPLFPLARITRKLHITGFTDSTRLFMKGLSSLDTDPSRCFHNMVSLQAIPRAGGVPVYPAVNESPVNSLDSALEHDRLHYLIDDVLALSDGASMASSIELRVPYLDSPIVDFATGLPAGLRLKYGRKWILKEILNRHDGAEFTAMPKTGFGLPLSRLIFEPHNRHLWSLFENKNHPIFEAAGPDRVDYLLKRFHNRSVRYSQELWALLVLGHWLDQRFV